MTDQDYKVLENRLRRVADRQGLRLAKSRRRDPLALDHGTYWLVDIDTNGVVERQNFGIGLDEVAEFLWGERGAWWRAGEVEQ